MTTTVSSSSGLIDAVVNQLSICQRAVHRNVDGVSQQESTLRPEAGCNSANWVVGHIVSARSSILRALGEEKIFPDEQVAMYRRGSDGSVEHGVPLADLLEALDRSQPILLARLQRATEAELNAKSPMSSPAGPDATLGAAVAAMAFHEAYHVGQLGVLRRLMGKPGAI
jgi:uncharacterized damage-inducible protein DinB